MVFFTAVNTAVPTAGRSVGQRPAPFSMATVRAASTEIITVKSKKMSRWTTASETGKPRVPWLPEGDVCEPAAGQGLKGFNDGSAVTGSTREEVLVVLLKFAKKAVPAAEVGS